MVTYITLGIKGGNIDDVKNSLESYKVENNIQFEYRILPDLTLNKGWTAVLIDDGMEEFDKLIVEHISNKLQTTVVGYEDVDTVSAMHVVTFINGHFEDEFEVLDFEIFKKIGYFNQSPDSYEDNEEISEQFDKYFQTIGFDPNATEILDAAKN